MQNFFDFDFGIKFQAQKKEVAMLSMPLLFFNQYVKIQTQKMQQQEHT